MSYPAPYPYMRVALGFIGGGILLAFVSAILRYPFILGSPSSLLPVFDQPPSCNWLVPCRSPPGCCGGVSHAPGTVSVVRYG